MVQITNTLVAAAIIVPAIAAPVIESREPKGFRSVAKVAGKVASGASLGLTVGGLLQGREEEIEAREPRLTSAQVKSIAKGVGAVAKTAKSGIEFGAAVAPIFPHKQRRDVEDIEVREPKFRISPSTLKHAGHAVAGAAGFAGTVAALNTQQQREFDDELDARRFSLGKVFKTAGKIASNFIREDEMDLAEREFDDAELETREPKFRISPSTLKHAGHAVAGAAGFAGTVAALNTQQQRDFDDAELDARDPKFSLGKVFKTAGKIASNFIREDEMDLAEREFDDAELETREPKFRISPSTLKHAGHAVAGAAGFAGTVAALNTQQQRDFEDAELDARDPKFSLGKVFKTAGKIASNFIREDEMDLAERDFEEDELEARKFSIGKIFKTVGKVASNFIREDELELAERDFDEEDLEARKFRIGGVLKTVGKIASNFIRDEETGDIYVIREVVDIDELD
ncbi:hypothetical protein D9613_007076 [Agrocybe pediades]|uniref:Uncharacterized protein n=1 Tax=Agrocybe pediades TaxID=84607 RepID=A0A8H4QI66_9AGAR|nr:hypothetical protein D9613_007076 [Agrocybe pediades]